MPGPMWVTEAMGGKGHRRHGVSSLPFVSWAQQTLEGKSQGQAEAGQWLACVSGTGWYLDTPAGVLKV